MASASSDSTDGSWSFCVKVLRADISRDDGVEEPDAQHYAHTVITTPQLADFWYGPDISDYELSFTNVVAGMDCWFGYKRNSRGMSLDSATFTALSNATLSISVYRGSTRNIHNDPCVGSVRIALQDMLTGAMKVGEQRATLQTADGSPYSGTLLYELIPKPGVVDAAAGGRALRLTGLRAAQLPRAWTLPEVPMDTPADAELPSAQDDASMTCDQATALATDPAENTARFQLKLQLTGKASTGVEWLVSNGVLTVVQDGSAPPAAEEESKTEPSQAWHWEIRWPEQYLWIDRASAAALAANLQAGQLVPGQLQRVEVEEVLDEQVGLLPLPPVAVPTWQAAQVLHEAGPCSPASIQALAPGWFVQQGTRLMGARLARLDVLRGCASVQLDLRALGQEGAHELHLPMTPLVGKQASDEALAAENTAVEERDAAWSARVEELLAQRPPDAAAAAAGGSGKDKKKKDSKGKSKPKASSKGKAGSKGKTKKSPRAQSAASTTRDDVASHVVDSASTVLAGATFTCKPALVQTPPATPVPVLRPWDIIEQRAAPPAAPPPMGAPEEFRRDVAVAVHAVAEQYAEVVAQLQADQAQDDACTPDQRRRALLAALNDSGVYVALKDRLRRSIVRVVRERFHRKDALGPVAGAAAAGELSEAVVARDTFLSQLYTYLMGQAHRAIALAFDLADQRVAAGPDGTAPLPDAPTPDMDRSTFAAARIAELPSDLGHVLQTGSPVRSRATSRAASRGGSPMAAGMRSFDPGLMPGTEENLHVAALLSEYTEPAHEAPAAQLLRVALESEAMGDVSRAGTLFVTHVATAEERCARGYSAGHWQLHPWEDYADFLLRVGDTGRASQALHQALSIDGCRVSALLTAAAVALVRARRRDAAAFAGTAVELLTERTVQGASPSAAALGSAHTRGMQAPEVVANVLLALAHTLAAPFDAVHDVPLSGSSPVQADVSADAAVDAVQKGLGATGASPRVYDDLDDVGTPRLSRPFDASEDVASSAMSHASAEAGGLDLSWQAGVPDAAVAWLLAASWALRAGPGLLPLAAHCLDVATDYSNDVPLPRAALLLLQVLRAEQHLAALVAARASPDDSSRSVAVAAARMSLDKALALRDDCAAAHVLAGELASRTGDKAAARDSWERALAALQEDCLAVMPLSERAPCTWPVLNPLPLLLRCQLRLAEAYLPAVAGKPGQVSAAHAQAAEEVALRAAKAHGWANAWWLAGRAALEHDAIDDAEASIAQASKLDNGHVGVWATAAITAWRAVPPRHAEAAVCLQAGMRAAGQDLKHWAPWLHAVAGAARAAGKRTVADALETKLN